MHPLIGIILVVVSAAGFGSLAILGKYAYADGLDTLTILFLRFSLSALVMSGILMLVNGPKPPMTGMGWTVIAGIVLIATVLPVMCFLAGLKRVGPTNAAMLSTLEPVVTVLLAMMLLGETLRPTTMLGGGLIVLAVLLLKRIELRRARSPGNQV